ncbi:MAG: class I SAM-dependent methyltransferase [Thermoflavifilum aggregans]|nr:class I SAM-dependent methyltransferase [Thermoflavifilum aggregans]
MAFAHHKDENLRFEQQVLNAEKYVLPFLQPDFEPATTQHVLEIGCGEGGVLKPFLQRGCRAVGVELVEYRLQLAKSFLKQYLDAGQLDLHCADIYHIQPENISDGGFDLVLLKDVIEHIPDQERLLGWLKRFLRPKGLLFIGFPPWYMPHGGHQQICEHKWLSLFPYLHLLPGKLYPNVLRWCGEQESTIQELLQVRSTGISIERLESIIKKQGYRIVRKQLYLINPIYQFKFGIKPVRQLPVVRSIPYLRDFVTTCAYYLLQPM